MIRKVICLALALGMLVALLGSLVGTAAPALTGAIVVTDQLGDPQDVFFQGDQVYFVLTYQVDGLPTNAEFAVRIVDGGGNVMATKDPVWTDVPNDGTHESWDASGAGWFTMGMGWSEDVYRVDAILKSTGQLLFSDSLTLIEEKIVIEPVDRSVFAPGETVTIKVDVDYDDDINVTVEELNVTWLNQPLVDYHWEIEWDIDADTETGAYTIWVNRSVDDSPLIWTTIWIDYFVIDAVWLDKSVYLPGESAIVQWRTVSIPEYLPVNSTLDFNMSYVDGIDSEVKWSNYTLTSSPSTVTIPEYADIQSDVSVDVKAYVGDYNTTAWLWIYLGTLQADVWTDSPDYRPGDSVIVTVEAVVEDDWWPWIDAAASNANVTISMDDTMGNPIALNLTPLTTNAMGLASCIISLPENMTEDEYRIIATVTKLGYTAEASENIDVLSSWILEVTTDKTAYIGGENIEVTVELLKNGVPQTPDMITYYFSTMIYGGMISDTTTSTVFTIVAPSGISDWAMVYVEAVLDGEIYAATLADWVEISPFILTLSASSQTYNPGDTIDLEVMAMGDYAGFGLVYNIWDEDGIQVQSGVLTLDTSGKDTFTFDVPSDDPSGMYSVRVTANDGYGTVVSASLSLTLIGDYIVKTWIMTGPAYVSGAYAPGQTVTVGFTITKQRSSLPDIPLVTAEILFNGLEGEINSFEDMSGELSVTIPDFTGSGTYDIDLVIFGLGTYTNTIQVDASGGIWESNVGGTMSAAELLMTVLLLVAVIILILMWMGKGGAAAAGAGVGKPSEVPPEPADEYQPKANVKCPACSEPIELATSKRPIEVMCPKCGTSQIVS